VAGFSTFTPPTETQLLPPFALPDFEGQPYDIGALRQHYNLVLCFVRVMRSTVAEFLRGLAVVSAEVVELEAKVVVVIPGSPARGASFRRELGIPFQVLSDEQGSLVDAFCGESLAVYVTDRFLEVFLAVRDTDVTLDRVLSRLRLIELQCPE